MPCDSVTTQSINLANAIPEILAEALKLDGWRIHKQTATEITAWTYAATLTWTKGSGLRVQGYDNDKAIADITKTYSRQAVSWAAQKAGWTVQQKPGNQLVVNRR